MATTATVVLRAAMPGIAGQSVTLNWNGTTVVPTFDPALPAHDSGPTTIIKVASGFVRDPWSNNPIQVAVPNPGEKVKEYSSLSGDEYMRFKMAEIQLRNENSPMPAGALESARWWAQQPRCTDLYGR